MGTPLTNLRVVFRRLMRSPGFSLMALLVLSLGLGVNLVMFNAAYALLWRPLRFPEPERLVTLSSRDGKGAVARGVFITGRQAALIRQQVPAVIEIGLVTSAPRIALWDGRDAIDLAVSQVNSGYWNALGIRPLAGEFFSQQDEVGETATHRALLTEAAWRQYFHGDAAVVGRSFETRAGRNSGLVQIIGIVPSGATPPFASNAELLVPLAWRSRQIEANSGDAFYRCVLRLRAGTPLESLSAEVHHAFQDAGLESGSQYLVEPLRSVLRPLDASTITLLQCAAWLLLALVCANLACLFGARAMARRREAAVQMALGARARDVVSIYLEEALVLCTAGMVLAFVLARLAHPVIVSMFPDLKRIGPELLDPSLLLMLFGAIVSLVSACAVGLPAARQALRTDLLVSLKCTGQSPGESRTQWPAVLLATQVSIVLVLLTVTGLISRSFAAAIRSDPGFDPAGVMTFRASLPMNGKALTSAGFELTQLIRDLPGTKDAAFAAEPPIGTSMATVMSAHGRSFGSNDPTIAFRMTSSRYFETLGARFVRGRSFSQQEVERGASVLVLNEAAAQVLFHGEDPVGREVHVGFLDLRSQVIGVVRNMRHESLDQPSAPVAYLPFIPVVDGGVSVVARTAVPPPVFLSELKARVSVWNNGALVRGFRPLEEITAATVRDRLISGYLVGWFAMLGLLVSSLGLYGALSGQLQRRRAEIGVRMALGASAQSVIGVLLGQGTRVLAAGIGAGLAASLAAGYFIRTMLYQVKPIDWVSSTVSVLLLVIAGLLACFVPAIRAVGVDPGVALRNE